jgi:hypothetical protein
MPIVDNFITRNGGDGIHVLDSSVQVLRNTARNNAGTGIFLSEGGDPIYLKHYFVANNAAVANDGHGIRVQPGMIDGGGNTATRNGLQPDCVNLVCS